MQRESILLAAWRLNRKVPLLLFGLVLANVGLYAVNAWVVGPRLDERQRLLIAKQNRVRDVRQAEETARTPVEAFRQAREQLQKFYREIPARKEFTRLIGEVFTLADEAGLDIARINYDPEELAEQDLLRYTLVFAVSGDYGQIKRFVHSLEQSKRLIVIEELSLSGGTGDQKGQVNLRLRLATFFRTGE